MTDVRVVSKGLAKRFQASGCPDVEVDPFEHACNSVSVGFGVITGYLWFVDRLLHSLECSPQLIPNERQIKAVMVAALRRLINIPVQFCPCKLSSHETREQTRQTSMDAKSREAT